MKKRISHPFLTLAIAFACSGATRAEPELLPRELLEKGWIQLFDGHTLFGWQPVGEAQWHVDDGAIRTGGEEPGFLMTTTQWSDFELVAEFRAPADTNSGIFLRTPLEPKDPAADCYELNIAPADNPFPTGSLVARQKTSLPATAAPAPDEWHKFRLTVWNNWVNVQINGQPTADYAERAPARIGHIGLQSNRGPVAFRNIRLRPLELQSLLYYGDLSSFTTERAEKSKFEVDKHKVLHLTGGPGLLETKDEFANFVLQLECKVNGDRLNSGIFFRALRDGRNGRSNGYESQIQNGYKNGDRTKPTDSGTGGIYRRQPARRIVAEDGAWFTKTIVADGPHIAVWVDGHQVTDWTDTRPPHNNPREGLRLDKGAIAIQGHDPAVDFSFRNIKAGELTR
jgi:Domain of Unknown Function (DUF1080)